MNSNPAELLNPVFNALDACDEDNVFEISSALGVGYTEGNLAQKCAPTPTTRRKSSGLG
jgi:hypothetical protein